jgi:hypothetical protein
MPRNPDTYTIEQVNADRTILPEPLNELLDSLTGNEGYAELNKLIEQFNRAGYSIVYGLDSGITSIQKI